MLKIKLTSSRQTQGMLSLSNGKRIVMASGFNPEGELDVDSCALINKMLAAVATGPNSRPLFEKLTTLHPDPESFSKLITNLNDLTYKFTATLPEDARAEAYNDIVKGLTSCFRGRNKASMFEKLPPIEELINNPWVK